MTWPAGVPSERDTRDFTLPEIAGLSGIDYRTLHNWVRRGLIAPSRQVANGSGSTNLFDLGDARQILVLAELRRGGLEISLLERTSRELRGLMDSVTAGDLLLIAGRVSVIRNLDDLDAAAVKDGPAVVVSLSRIDETLLGRDPA